MRHIEQVTLRGVDKLLAEKIVELAKKESISINKAAIRLLKKGAGIVEKKERLIGNSLDYLIGTWTENEERQFFDSIQSLEKIDPEVWE